MKSPVRFLLLLVCNTCLLCCYSSGSGSGAQANGLEETSARNPLGFVLHDSPSVSVDRLDSRQSSDHSPGPNDINVERVLLKEVDADGNNVKPMSSESWKRMKVEQLLEELSNALAANWPIYRNARTYPSSSSAAAASQQAVANSENSNWSRGDARQARENTNNNVAPARGSQWLVATGNPETSNSAAQATVWPDLELDQWRQQQPGARSSRSKERKAGSQLIGAVWLPTSRTVGPSGQLAANKPTPFYSDVAPGRAAFMGRNGGAGGVNSNLVSAVNGPLIASLLGASSGQPQAGSASSAASSLSHHHHRSGTEEVALHMPTHKQLLGSGADYEAKRTETTRWNNLRGMWGKRSISDNNSSPEASDKFKEFHYQQAMQEASRDFGAGRAHSTENGPLKGNGDDDDDDGPRPAINPSR